MNGDHTIFYSNFAPFIFSSAKQRNRPEKFFEVKYFIGYMEFSDLI
jgi:hypothetical protein